MRHFHVLRNREHCPIVNLDKLWSMLPEGTLEEAKAAGGKAPVIDVTDSVSFVSPSPCTIIPYSVALVFYPPGVCVCFIGGTGVLAGARVQRFV